MENYSSSGDKYLDPNLQAAEDILNSNEFDTINRNNRTKLEVVFSLIERREGHPITIDLQNSRIFNLSNFDEKGALYARLKESKLILSQGSDNLSH